ncbi:MAG: AAA family ATPase [bacterium]|nr:AAA family ATPase [bacterium]
MNPRQFSVWCSRRDVVQMIEYYREKGLVYHDTAGLLDILTHWYGNYRFSGDEDARVYNSDMVLYFIKNYIKRKKLPDDLIDRNVRIDYGKLRHLVIIDKEKTGKPTPNGNFSKLKQIIEDGGTSTKLEKGFPLEKVVDPAHFKSLLFYLGLLTIKGPEKNMVRLEIPNETVQRLYYDYIEEAYRETDVFALDLSKYSDLMTDMAYDGKWKPLFDFITGRMRESMSLRDLITGEKSIQAFLNVYLGLSDLYIIHTEREYNKGYVDILMEPFLARYEGVKYSYLLEIKYLKSGVKPGEAKVEELRRAAEEQLRSYSMDKKLGKALEKTTLVKLVLIFSGHELLYIGPPGL